MHLPDMKYADRSRKSSQVKFGGLNRTLGAGDGQIRDMMNMTGDHGPVLAVRRKRRLLRTLEAPGGIFSWDKLCWVDGDGFYFDGIRKGTVSKGQKSFCAMGNNILIWPDKCCYNVAQDTFQSLEAAWAGASLTFGNGKLYGEEAKANCIHSPGVSWDSLFRPGDAVTITGCTLHPENNKTPVIREIDGDRMYFYENIFTLKEDGDYTETGMLRVERRVPDLKFLCENENRIWGCDDTTIYASKLGDPFNFSVYDGLQTDSFAVTPGAAGRFTGCISYKGFAVFFKEQRIYKVYGSIPSSFCAVDSASIGIPEGEGQSIAIAGEMLFYLSGNGVMAYSGGIPAPAGEVLGQYRYRNAAAGSDGLKYWVSMEDQDGQRRLFVYDTMRGTWHIEDEPDITHFARWNGQLCFLTETGEIWSVDGEDGEQEGDVPWMVEFADFTEQEANKKTVGKHQLRAELDEGATMEVWMQFDSDGIWHRVKSMISETEKRSFTLPLIPRRCDHYSIKLTGTGGCRIYSMTRTYSTGSELKSTMGRN